MARSEADCAACSELSDTFETLRGFRKLNILCRAILSGKLNHGGWLLGFIVNSQRKSSASYLLALLFLIYSERQTVIFMKIYVAGKFLISKLEVYDE